MAVPEERRVLVAVYANVALYAICYQLQSPIEPFLVERLVKQGGGGDAAYQYGQLQSAFSALQTVGSLAVGVLLDRAGPRATMVLVFLCSAWSYYLRATVTTLAGLYWSKVPALLQHAFLVAQAVIAQAVPHARRPNALGRIMTAYTVGATIGPYVGGRLGGVEGNHRAGALAAFWGSLLSAALCVVLLPARAPHSTLPDGAAEAPSTAEEQAATASAAKPPTGSCDPGTLAHYVAVLRTAWLPLSVKFITACGVAMYTACLPLVYKNVYGASPAVLGTVMAVTSIINALAGLFAVGWVSSCLGERNAIRIAINVLAVGYLCIIGVLYVRDGGGALASVYPLVVLNVLLSVVGHSMATLVTSQSTSLVGEHDKGAVIGIEHALFSLARVASPSIGVVLMEAESARLTMLAVSCCGTATAAAVLLHVFGGAVGANHAPASAVPSPHAGGGGGGGGAGEDTNPTTGVSHATRKRARKLA